MRLIDSHLLRDLDRKLAIAGVVFFKRTCLAPLNSSIDTGFNQ